MSAGPKVQVPWADIDTLLLDMDGTLLDLAFDNFFWLELVPSYYARARGLDRKTAQREVEQRYSEVVGTLPWYCVDHWTEELRLDIRGLKAAHRHLIRYLPCARSFLEAATGRVARLILVTNAHPATLEIKAEATGIHRWMDAVVSSHDYGKPKEDEAFWAALVREHGLDPGRCFLVDDTPSVLSVARRCAIGHVVAVRRPDSRAGPRAVAGFDAVDAVGELA